MKSFVAVALCIGLASGIAEVRTEQEVLLKEVCYDHYGCFSTESPWTSLIRPNSALPDPPYEVGTRFLLFTRSNPTVDYELVSDNEFILQMSPYDSGKKTVYLVHGFTDSHMSDWMVNAKNALLQKEDINVISVDWAPGAKGTYLKATANARMVGAQLTRFTKFLEAKANLDLPSLRVVAHSVGAHAVAYTGADLSGRIGHITALDPAEPYFGGTDKMVRLDESDAAHVSVIHTNGESIFGLGMRNPLGHVDLFVNGGNSQPGCTDALGSLVGSIVDLITLDFDGPIGLWACSHVRAVDYFVESIQSTCPFVAYSCGNYGDFNDGKCTTSCSAEGSCTVLGYGSERDKAAKGTYYLHTDKDNSFCLQSVRFDSLVSPSQEKTNGKLTVQFRRSDGTVSSKFTIADGVITNGQILNHWLELPSKVLVGLGERPVMILHYTRGGLSPITQPKTLALDNINLYVLDEELQLVELKYPGVTLEAGTDLIVTAASE